jgi:hypothetical protein
VICTDAIELGILCIELGILCRECHGVVAALGQQRPCGSEDRRGQASTTSLTPFISIAWEPLHELRDSGLPADVLLGKFKKDVSFALRRGTIAQVTTHALDAGQRALVRRG